MPTGENEMKSLAITLILVATAWSLSSLGYFQMYSALELDLGYSDAPLAYSVYYGMWVLVVVGLFGQRIHSWAMRQQPPQDWRLIVVCLLIFTLFTGVVLPALPEVTTVPEGESADPLIGTAWYFLPKSVEIAFQQVLIIAIVLSLSQLNLEPWRMALVVAVLFGGFHITLALNGSNGFYVMRYTLAATAYGAVVPYLLTQVRSGFVLAYAVHWSFYAADMTLGHFALS